MSKFNNYLNKINEEKTIINEGVDEVINKMTKVLAVEFKKFMSTNENLKKNVRGLSKELKEFNEKLKNDENFRKNIEKILEQSSSQSNNKKKLPLVE